MSNTKFKAYKPKFEEIVVRKDLTPKNSKYSPKISPIYGNMRGGTGGGTLKPELTNKIKLTRPSTSKHSQDQQLNYFTSKQNHDKQSFYHSNKRIEINRKSIMQKPYEYIPRSKSKSPQNHPGQIVREQIYVHPKKIQNSHQNRDVQTQQNQYPNMPKVLPNISNFQAAKHSMKVNGMIKGYSASTNQGPIRDYNQDRVAIILNIAKPEHCKNWKKAAYFGVFDGHGGMQCADFLRDNLHSYISRQKIFPDNMIQAIKVGFEKCQNSFNEQSYAGKFDHSGSCACITFFYGNSCYISNVGDSRAIMSAKQGKFIHELSIDHKASDEYEQRRIIQSGGRIYQTKLRNGNPSMKVIYEGEQHSFILGPHRVLPGRLSVTRTFGDIEAKLSELGGNPRAVTCAPEIQTINISQSDDFIIIASDGIYDKMSNSQIVQIVWDTFNRDRKNFHTLHEFCGKAVQSIMKLAFLKKTLDNITVVMIALQGLQNYFRNNVQKVQVNSQQTVQLNKSKGTSKMQHSIEKRYPGGIAVRSNSPGYYSSMRTKSFYRN